MSKIGHREKRRAYSIYTPIDRRRSDQIYISWNDEAAIIDDFQDDLLFNWTMTFSHHSEASYCAYGCYKKNPKPPLESTFRQKIRKEFDERKNEAVWAVSNCGIEHRNNFVLDLGNHFPISIRGNCETYLKHRVSKGTQIKFHSEKCGMGCLYDQFREQKFYLSLENRDREDYVTEKFWRSISMGIIPIVISPRKRDYERIAPKDSFIHFDDFDRDLKRLTTYLHQVSTDFDTYYKHRKWSIEFVALAKGEDVDPYRICELCAQLNNQKSTIYYKKLSDFF